jgi:arsenical pump membrane protein
VQPVLLACLASSALPVSNLTNLIAASWTGVGTGGFVSHLALPSLAATLVGWSAYRRLGHRARPSPAPPVVAATTPAPPATGKDAGAGVMKAAALVVGAVVLGFTFGYLVGVQPWMVALAAVAALVIVSARTTRDIPRSVPWASVPAGTAVTVLSLGVLASATAAHLSLGPVLKGGGVVDLARDAALSAGAANVVNNLPALLVGLEKMGHHAGPGLWGVLVGVNMGPVLLVTGSLASLLWLATMRRLGVAARARDFTRYGVAVGLPAAASGLGVTLLMKAARFW